jgi:lysophospholipase L1-like esterase
MITGYPHDSGGLFEVACGLVEKSLGRSVEPKLFSLGGFPAPRAEKYFKLQVCTFNPKYVVIQFGSTDAARPIRARRHPPKKPIQLGRPRVRHPTAFTIARWHIQTVVGFLWKTDPITPLSSYITAIEHMVYNSVLTGITPIVLSPFVFGSRHSLKSAANYTNALHDMSARLNCVIFVDCFQLLSRFCKSKILLSDGIHLSRLGHHLVGEAIAQAIVADIGSGSRPAPTGRRKFSDRLDFGIDGESA